MESSVKEDIYIKPPEVLELIGDGLNDYVKPYKLNKAIYGLVQASINFYQEIKTFFIKNGYVEPLTQDNPVYYPRTSTILKY